MNCAYHSQNVANVQCNGCGKPLCPACDHRIKGFPYCQDCIVMGVDLLRQQHQSNYVPYVKKRTSPFVATVLSFCPGLGAVYNGQTVKALVHFAVFVGLIQMAFLTGAALFFFGFIGMWLFAAVDAWRSAQAIRSGLTPDVAEDILVKRFSGNPKLWGIVLTVLGVAFFFRDALKQTGIIKAVLPILLIGLGIYILRGYIFKPKTDEQRWQDFDNTKSSPTFASALIEPRYRSGEFENRGESRYGGWQGR